MYLFNYPPIINDSVSANLLSAYKAIKVYLRGVKKAALKGYMSSSSIVSALKACKCSLLTVEFKKSKSIVDTKSRNLSQ